MSVNDLHKFTWNDNTLKESNAQQNWVKFFLYAGRVNRWPVWENKKTYNSNVENKVLAWCQPFHSLRKPAPMTQKLVSLSIGITFAMLWCGKSIVYEYAIIWTNNG